MCRKRPARATGCAGRSWVPCTGPGSEGRGSEVVLRAQHRLDWSGQLPARPAGSGLRVRVSDSPGPETERGSTAPGRALGGPPGAVGGPGLAPRFGGNRGAGRAWRGSGRGLLLPARRRPPQPGLSCRCLRCGWTWSPRTPRPRCAAPRGCWCWRSCWGRTQVSGGREQGAMGPPRAEGVGDFYPPQEAKPGEPQKAGVWEHGGVRPNDRSGGRGAGDPTALVRDTPPRSQEPLPLQRRPPSPFLRGPLDLGPGPLLPHTQGSRPW